jgi:hypothetical protein
MIVKTKVSFFWEISLAILSFLFYKMMKFIIGNLYTIYLAFNKKQAYNWRILSAESLQNPLSMPVLMTKGPRWNTHAIIGTLGPISVKNSIALNLETIKHSAKSWVGAIYSFPNYQTIASFDSYSLEENSKWQSIELNPGKYTLGLRYYNWADKVTFPLIKIDDRETVGEQKIEADVNKFYENLSKKSNLFYLSLHYYIFTILRLRKWLPESFIRNEYLPVGAPDTDFFYDYINKEQALEIEINPNVLSFYEIYLTVYDRSSLPVISTSIKEEKYKSAPLESNGFYLLRLRHKVRAETASTAQLPLKFNQSIDENKFLKKIKLC